MVISEGCDRRGVPFSQGAQLIKSIGHIGKINDFTIKQLQLYSLLLTGSSQHTLSWLSNRTILSTATEADPILDNTPSTILQQSKAVDTRIVIQQGIEPASGDNGSGLSNRDPDLSNDNGGFSSDDKLFTVKRR